MATPAPKTQPQPQPEVDIITDAELFFEKNKKAVSIVVTALLVVGLGAVAFFGFYVPSKEGEAQVQMFQAQRYFEIDSFNLALNGDGNYDGFLKIIDDYAFTKSAELAQYYAGISYLRMGNYDEAISHLKKYSSGDPVTNATALGAIGDAYSEKNNMDEAISYYKKAAGEAEENELVAPIYLFRAGLLLKVQGKNADALKMFQKVKTEFPQSMEARDIDKYIAMVS